MICNFYHCMYFYFVWCTLYNVVVCFIITTNFKNQEFSNQCVYCIRNLKYVHGVHAELTTNMCRKPSKMTSNQQAKLNTCAT